MTTVFVKIVSPDERWKPGIDDPNEDLTIYRDVVTIQRMVRAGRNVFTYAMQVRSLPCCEEQEFNEAISLVFNQIERLAGAKIVAYRGSLN